jgi:hypothetical protein
LPNGQKKTKCFTLSWHPFSQDACNQLSRWLEIYFSHLDCTYQVLWVNSLQSRHFLRYIYGNLSLNTKYISNSYQKPSIQTVDILSHRLKAFGDNSKMTVNVMIVKKIFAKAFVCFNIEKRFHIDGNNFCRLLSFKDGIALRRAYSVGSLHDKAIYIFITYFQFHPLFFL